MTMTLKHKDNKFTCCFICALLLVKLPDVRHYSSASPVSGLRFMVTTYSIILNAALLYNEILVHQWDTMQNS